ncbi:LysR substrate-binding domain-containing protein, partial [Burkholderia sp. SIMBA_057]
VELHMGTSASLLAQFDERRLDAVIVRYGVDQPPRDDAQVLFSEPLGWLATPEWLPRVGEPLALALLSPPCNVRDVALRTLT